MAALKRREDRKRRREAEEKESKAGKEAGKVAEDQAASKRSKTDAKVEAAEEKPARKSPATEVLLALSTAYDALVAMHSLAQLQASKRYVESRSARPNRHCLKVC